MKPIYKIFLSFLLPTLTVSCSKDINLEPVSSISSLSFWKTEQDAKGGLYGMYSILRGEAENSNFMYWGEARSEVMGPSFGTGPNVYWNNLLDRNSAGPGWQGLYKVIHHANLLIKYVPGISFTNEKEKKNIQAQAYATRAFAYFWIARIWGDAILITEPFESFTPESIQKERSPVNEVFALIKEDLEKSLQLFSDNNIPTGRFLWSKPAVNTLKADVYLWTAKKNSGGDQDLNTALNSLSEVESADVLLLDDYERIFAYNNKGNKEILFAIRFAEFESGENWAKGSYMTSFYAASNFDQETIEAIGAMSPSGGSYTISDNLRSQFNILDKRRRPTFIEAFTIDGSGTRHFYGSFFSKYKGTVSGGVRLFVDDIIIYRYADVLLMKAEIKNALGQNPESEMNEMRTRAYGDNFSNFVFVSGSKMQNDELILKERLFEFAFEGKRWFDLIRFGKAFELVPSLAGRSGQDYLLLFPISESVLSLEPKVKQNPGY